MENRRQDYRHSFSASDQFKVELKFSRPEAVHAGVIVDLSLGGMKVLLDDPTVEMAVDDRVEVDFSAPPGDVRSAVPFNFNAIVVHKEVKAEQTYYCFEFLPHLDPALNELREKELWTFLMNEQRRQALIFRKQRKGRG